MQLRKYTFPFVSLDDAGHERETRLADDKDVDQVLDDKGEISVSDHIMQLVDQEQDRWPMLDFKTAVERVRKKNVHLFRLYSSESGGRLRVY